VGFVGLARDLVERAGVRAVQSAGGADGGNTGCSEAKRSHGRGVAFCAEATLAGFIAKAKRRTVNSRMFPDNEVDLSGMGYS
jgi:hypothetical protein